MNKMSHQRPSFDWKALVRPFSVLAPMDGITDTAFRRLIRAYGPPDVFYCEFVHVDRLCGGLEDETRGGLRFCAEERPLIAQIWGGSPERTYTAVRMLVELGFDGIDLNMSCPTPKVVASGCCAALIKNPGLAGEFLQAAQEGANGEIPVSVKTRLGFDVDEIETWAQRLLRLKPAALTIHGRLAMQMYSGTANWHGIAKVVKLREALACDTVIIGNGDVQSWSEIKAKHRRYGVDGVMVGRAALKNPSIFNRDDPFSKMQSSSQRLELMAQHARLCRQQWGDEQGCTVLKRFLKSYLVGFKGAAELRAELMKTVTCSEMDEVVRCYRQRYSG